MDPLSQTDVDRLLDVVDRLRRSVDVMDFAAVATAGVGELVPCDVVSYNEVDARRRRFRFVSAPTDAALPRTAEMFIVGMVDHPFILHTDAVRKAGTIRMTDLVGQQDFRRRAAYNEFYRPHGVEHLMVTRLATRTPEVFTMAAMRAAVEFSGRERHLLDRLRPHLARAYHDVGTLSGLRAELALLLDGCEDSRRAILLLGADGRITRATAMARAMLRRWFGRGAANGPDLPDVLAAWVRQAALPAHGGDPPRERHTFALPDGNRRLIARMLVRGERRLLIVEEELQSAAAGPAAAGLSRREAEVLSWLAAGRGNREIAELLALSPHTVRHVIERIYAKLGVDNRAAATAIALNGNHNPGE